MKRWLIAPAIALFLFAQSSSANADGPSNVVIATNQTDGRFVVQGRVMVSRVAGDVAAPLNFAMAQSTTCNGCTTFAVALQLDFASRNAETIAPQNVAVAVNGGCNGCVTVAKAVQVFYTVDDPTQIPPDISAAIRDLNSELVRIAADRTITPAQAESRIDSVIARFLVTALSFDAQRQIAAN